MTTINDGGPAFPRPSSEQQGAIAWAEEGMSLRDYFAAKCFSTAYQHVGANKQGWNGVANVAYAMADAMLKARQP